MNRAPIIVLAAPAWLYLIGYLVDMPITGFFGFLGVICFVGGILSLPATVGAVIYAAIKFPRASASDRGFMTIVAGGAVIGTFLLLGKMGLFYRGY